MGAKEGDGDAGHNAQSGGDRGVYGRGGQGRQREAGLRGVCQNADVLLAYWHTQNYPSIPVTIYDKILVNHPWQSLSLLFTLKMFYYCKSTFHYIHVDLGIRF